MTRSLPPNPSLRYLQEEAKDLLKAQRRKDPAACATLRVLRRFHDAGDDDILAAEIALHEVQFALAMEYGFASWEKLREHVTGAAAVPKSYRALEDVFRGHCMKIDTFSLSVHAAAALLGRQIDYETVLILSTNAFCLTLDDCENCTAWWHMSGRNIRMDFVAQALGLEFRRLELPDVGMRPGMSEDALAVATGRTRKEIAPIVRREMESGAVVITEGGWQVTGGRYGFVPWCHWGIVTVADDKELCGATLVGNSLQGHWDVPMTHFHDLYAVLLLEDGMDLPAPQSEMLRLAANRIAGRVSPVPAGRVPLTRLHFGLDAMDLWIRHMRQVESFCEACGSNGWRCATSTANALISGAEAAARWLSNQAEQVRPEAGEPLAKAAGGYRRMCRLIEPALADGEGGYKSFIGNLEKQRTHAEAVLVPIRDELAAIGAALEKASGLI